jgi:hypothetical protein
MTPRKPTPAVKNTKSFKPGAGSGTGFNVGALLKDVRVLGALGGVAVIALLVVVVLNWPEGTDKFREPYQKLKVVYDEVSKQAEAKPSAADWQTFCDGTKKKLEPIDKEVKALNSGHQINSYLVNALGGLKGIANSGGKPQEAESRLNQAKRSLESAAKALKL